MAVGACGKWLQSRTNFEKTFLSLSVILLFTVFILILVVVIGRSPCGSNGSEICDTKICLETAGNILSKGDFDVNPCEDFYEFACGKYARRYPMLSDPQRVSVADETADAVLFQLKAWLESTSGNNSENHSKAKILYRSCMHSDQQTEKPVEILKEAFDVENLGRWPVITDLWTEDLRLEQVIAALILLDIPAVAQFEVLHDSKTDSFVAKLSPGLPFSRDENDARTDALSQFVESALALLGIPRKLTSSKSDDILTTESKIWQLKRNSDSECLKVNFTNEELGLKKLGSYNNIDEVIRNSRVEWKDIVTNVFEVLNGATAGRPIDIYCKRHIREFSDYFYNDSPGRVYSYLGWRFFLTIMPYLSPELRRLHQENLYLLYAGNENTQRQVPKWKTCVGLVEQYMFPVLMNVYRDEVVTERLLEKKMAIASSVRTSLSELFSRSKLLMDDEKRLLQQKVENSRFELPTVKFGTDNDKLDRWFRDVQLHEQRVINNVLKLRKFKVFKNMRRTVVPLEDYLEWDEESFVTSDRFLFKHDRILIGFDKITQPYLSTAQQRYMNYGAFGTHLARQLSMYANGTIGDREAAESFNAFVPEAFQLQMKNNDCNLPRKNNSKNPNMDDWKAVLLELSSIHASYEAYHQQKHSESQVIGLDLTEDQMFFLSYAQSMCEAREDQVATNGKVLAKERVNFALRNFKPFSTSYTCLTNVYMNPSRMCNLWD